jgi:hypothetical protein
MPNELKEESIFNKAVALYREKIGKEPYQPLSSLLTKLKNLCQSSKSSESMSA